MATADRPALEDIFPRLIGSAYRVTSPATRQYNCIAWAVGTDDCPWDHTPGNPFAYWPHRIPRDGQVSSLVAVFQTLGYVACDHGRVEEGVEKLALYADDNEYTHVARQLENGKWTSKLGGLEDIEHELPEDVLCDDYGQVVGFMKRPFKDSKAR